MVEGILDGLRWLGLDWDEGPGTGGPFGPYFQSERVDDYRTEAEQLVAKGAAYYCFCPPDELKAKREAAEKQGSAWRYDRTCLSLTPDQVASRERTKTPRTIRVRVPDARMTFDDVVHGPIEFDGSNIEDFIILRSDGHPTYHLTVVSDDVRMQITHVVRGDDHISNTPKQMLLYRAFDAPLPQFAHVPLILGPDKKRLSKRHGATSVMEYASKGYLPEAMVNFLALLGWSPGAGDREIFTRGELSAAFDLAGISGGDAVFNAEKLDWFNQQHIARLTPSDLALRLKPSFERAGLWDPAFLTDRHAWFFAVLEQLKPRAKKLDDFLSVGGFFFADHVEFDEPAVAKHLRVDGMAAHLGALEAAWAELPSFDVAALEASLRAVADERAVKAATLIHAVRVVLTGRTTSPGLFDVAALLGRDRTAARLASAIRLISAH
jgi:glutamyl-tRNA synthetase